MRRSASMRCASMPPVMTIFAQARSAAASSSVLRLTSRTVHDFGSNAASVIMPSGAAGYFAPINSQAPS
jgi:hypothetical protein